MIRQYLTITGNVDDDGQLALLPVFLVEVDEEIERGLTVESPHGAVTVEMVDDAQVPLGRYQLPIASLCEEGSQALSLVVMGRVPYDEGAREIRIYRGEQLVAERQLSGRKPKVRFTWRPPKQVRGQVTVSWTGDSRGAEPLRYVLSYRDPAGKSWIPVTLPTTATEYVVDFDLVPQGRTRLGLSATDGVNAVFVRSAQFHVLT